VTFTKIAKMDGLSNVNNTHMRIKLFTVFSVVDSLQNMHLKRDLSPATLHIIVK
jgi:hypothetical protein